ncbi:hypothetical protein OAO87_00405 [bacterium]|nr:hypothetical protein [bacterium]
MNLTCSPQEEVLKRLQTEDGGNAMVFEGARCHGEGRLRCTFFLRDHWKTVQVILPQSELESSPLAMRHKEEYSDRIKSALLHDKQVRAAQQAAKKGRELRDE